MTPWSPELRALVRPYRTLAALGAEPAPEDDAASSLVLLVRRPLLLLVCLGAFVSFTTAGRLVVGHVGWAALGWAFLPLYQVGAVALTVVLLAPARRRAPGGIPRLVDRAGLARAPWLVFLVGFTLVHVAVGDPNASFFSTFLRLPMLVVFVVCAVWSRVVEHAFWRGAVGLGRGRALLAVLLGDVLVLGPGVVWYLATNQLQPLLGGGG